MVGIKDQPSSRGGIFSGITAEYGKRGGEGREGGNRNITHIKDMNVYTAARIPATVLSLLSLLSSSQWERMGRQLCVSSRIQLRKGQGNPKDCTALIRSIRRMADFLITFDGHHC